MEITDHIFVPKHIKLNEEEAKKVLELFNVQPNQLPKIKKNDPVVKKIGAKPDDLIKIVRNSPTVIQTEFFRIVSEE